MLYQLSYASAAQTDQVYQKRYSNCKAPLSNSSTSVTSVVEILRPHAYAAKGYPFSNL